MLAVINTKRGRRDEILAAFCADVQAVGAEKGRIDYVAHVDASGIGPSLGRRRGFGGAPHMVAYWQRIRDLIESRAIHVLGRSISGLPSRSHEQPSIAGWDRGID